MNIIETKLLLFVNSKSFWYLFLSQSKSCFITSSASTLIMIYMLSLFEWMAHSSSLSIKEMKLFAIVNWIFHILDVLRLCMMSFNYGLILCRYSLTNSVLLLSLLLLHQYNFYSKSYSLLLVYYNFHLYAQKDSKYLQVF